MPATSRRTVRRKPAVPDLTEVVNEYCQNRSMRERSAYHENRLKAGLMGVLEQVGELDGDEGEHRKLLLDDPVEFTTYKGEKGTKKTVIGVQRQRRAGSMSLNEDRTLAFLAGVANTAKRKALMAQCLTTVQVINEDAILAANFEGLISDDELKKLYDESDPTFAFYLITED